MKQRTAIIMDVKSIMCSSHVDLPTYTNISCNNTFQHQRKIYYRYECNKCDFISISADILGFHKQIKHLSKVSTMYSFRTLFY